MSDVFLLSARQMARIVAVLSAGARCAAGRRPAGGERHRLCDQERAAVEGRAEGLWPAQDALQSLHSLEPARRLRPHLRRALPARAPKPERIMINSTSGSLFRIGEFDEYFFSTPTLDRSHRGDAGNSSAPRDRAVASRFSTDPISISATAGASRSFPTACRFFVNTKDSGIATWIMLGGIWETFVDDIMQELLREGDACLDIGANLGYYTVKMAHKVGPSGRVLAFEPNSELFPFLSENVSVNAFSDRAKALPVALGAAAGRGNVRFEYSNMGGGRVEAAEF